MSVLLYIISIALSSSLAASTPISSDPLYQRLHPSNSSTSNPTQFGQRSTWDIVWGCLTTIFACSWVSVHPHIPPPDAKWWRIALIRLELMVWTILGPEIVILLAALQWLAARELKKFYQERGWTMTHGFFIQMGGFMLFDGEVRKGVISPRRFKTLVENQEIAFPEITEEEIKDRSKGDGLSKGLVLMQVAWFIVQFLARRADGLAITQLELVTFAFAAMNGFMYIFWWNKPLDIRLPIRVHFLHPTIPINESMETHSATSSSSETGAEPLFNTPSLVTLDKSLPETMLSDKHISNINDDSQQRNSWKRVIMKAWDARFHVVDYNADFQLLDKMNVPIFFSSLTGPRSISLCGYGISAILGVVFGVIHCAGWNLVFPSAGETYMWRIASIFIIAYPAWFLLHMLLEVLFPGFYIKLSANVCSIFEQDAIREVFFFGVLFPMYIMARLFILLEAFLALRILPDSATYAVRWTTFLPHI